MPEEPFLAQRQSRGSWLATVLVLLLVSTGCQSPVVPEPPPPQPAIVAVPPATHEPKPGTRRVMADVPAPVRVLLFTWFAERFAGTPACAAGVRLARAEAERAERELVQGTRREWIAQSGGLLVEARAGRVAISSAAVAQQHALPAFTARLQALMEVMGGGIQAAAPLPDCLADGLWPEMARLPRPEFVAWHRRAGGRKSLPSLPGTAEARGELGQLVAAVAVREAVLERLLRAEELERRRKFPEALQAVEAIAADAAASKALGLLGDTEISRRIQEKRRFLPQTTVSAECESLRRYHRQPLSQALRELARDGDGSLANVHRRVRALERRLSQRLTQWQADTRFEPALRRYGSEIQDLIKAALAGRLAAWEAELREIPPPLRSWEQYEKLAIWLAGLRKYSSPGGVAYRFADANTDRSNPLARPVLQVAEERLLPIYAAGLAETFVAWRAFAERQVSLHLRHGVDLAVAERILAMAGIFPEAAVPAAIQEHIRWGKERIASSLDRFLANEAACSIRIEAMTSATAGLGLTWSRDLEARLRDVLARTGHQAFARVVPVDGPDEKLPRSLLVTRGRIADFSADETTEKASIREVVEVAEPKRIGDGKGKDRYAQEVSRRAIHALTIERVAHVRVQFQIQLGDGKEDVEVNRFFRKQFVQESSHPFLDMAVVETRKADRKSALPLASAPLRLRSERVWTPSEMLDWARQDTLTEMAERVCHRLEAYPLQLVFRAQEATKQEDWLAAADAWGYAVAYLSRLQPPKDEGASELPKAVLTRRAEIAKWQEEARRQLLQALLAALREHMKEGGEAP